MGVIITFNPADFQDQYPEFAACTTGQCTNWFNRATNIFANDGNGPVNNATQATALLYLLTAHIGWLNAPRDPAGNPAATGAPAPATVGRINTAGEGSVNVGLDMGTATAGSPSQPWYMQTKYGAEFWAATAQFRTAVYSAFKKPIPQPIFPGPRFFRVT